MQSEQSGNLPSTFTTGATLHQYDNGFSRYIVVLRSIVIFGFFFVTFIGLSPFNGSTPDERATGGGIERVVMASLFALALPVLWQYRYEALACARRTKLIWFLVAFCLLSALWSDYPDLTLRRASLLLMITAITLAIAVSETDARRFHSSLFLFLATVMAINLLVTVLWPAQAISDIGVQGLYSQKNSAGQIAMVAVIVGFTWLIGTGNVSSRLWGMTGVALALLFLVLTESKTSLGLTALSLLVGTVMILAASIGVGIVLFVYAAVLACAISICILFSIHDFELASLVKSLPIDTTFSTRDSLWQFAADRASERFWLGHGYGAFWDVGEDNDPLNRLEPGTWLGDVEKGVINQAHNGYLELWLNVGIGAAVLGTAAIFGGLIFDCKQFASASASNDKKALYLAAGLMMLIYLLHNFTEATLFLRGQPLFSVIMLLRFASIRHSDQFLKSL